jgi:hypothetical protein
MSPGKNSMDKKNEKTDKAEFAKFMSEADAFKAVTHKIKNSLFPVSSIFSMVCLTGRLWPALHTHSTRWP